MIIVMFADADDVADTAFNTLPTPPRPYQTDQHCRSRHHRHVTIAAVTSSPSQYSTLMTNIR